MQAAGNGAVEHSALVGRYAALPFALNDGAPSR